MLDAQRQLLAAELAATRANGDRYIATATLFKALGGGWHGAQVNESKVDDIVREAREKIAS